MRLSQLSSTCSVIPLATKNFALIATLLAVAVSHVQLSTVICCPLQVDRVDFFFKQKTAYEISACLVGSEMCIRDSKCAGR